MEICPCVGGLLSTRCVKNIAKKVTFSRERDPHNAEMKIRPSIFTGAQT